jgi:xylan 1,4-beta-xylosidase
MSTDPKSGELEGGYRFTTIGGWDPAFFVDDDGKLYMYNGSSNQYPFIWYELNRKNYLRAISEHAKK